MTALACLLVGVVIGILVVALCAAAADQDGDR